MKTSNSGVRRHSPALTLSLTVCTITRGMKPTAYPLTHSSLVLTMEGLVLILGNASAKLVLMDYAWV